MVRKRYDVTRRGKTEEVSGAMARRVRGLVAKRRLGLTMRTGFARLHPRGSNGRFIKK